MSVDGLWTSEIYGLHGWENAGVVMLDNGQAMGGGRHQYTVGTYSETGDDIKLRLHITYHGQPRTLFGASDRELALCLDGRSEDGIIEGSVYREGNPKMSLLFRLTKRADRRRE